MCLCSTIHYCLAEAIVILKDFIKVVFIISSKIPKLFGVVKII